MSLYDAKHFTRTTEDAVIRDVEVAVRANGDSTWRKE
jgi:hypothetical protein